jgi:ABC-type multidrug transport system fused ATPase/permease subunit
MATDIQQLDEEFAQRKMDKSLFRRLWAYTAPYRRRYGGNIALAMLATVSSLLGPKIIQWIIDRQIATGNTRGVLIGSGVFLANLLIGWVLTILQTRSVTYLGERVVNDIRASIFRHIQRLSMNYFDRVKAGRIIARADTDVDALNWFVSWGGSTLLTALLTLVGALYFMFQYDMRLCLATAVIIPPLAIASRIYHSKAWKAYRKTRESYSRVTATLAENISGVRVVQAFGREAANLEHFREVHTVHNVNALAAAQVWAIYFPFIGIMSAVGSCIIMGYGGTLVMGQEIRLGELTAFLLYLRMFFGPIDTMGDVYNNTLSTAASAERIFALLDTEPAVRNREDAKELPPMEGRVEFDHVWLRYDSTPENEWVLQDISFVAEPGQTIAFVGKTGAGKSSIVNLIPRFYESQRGRILVDGHDIAQVTLESLHRQMGIVSQDNFLFTGTVMENIKYGRPEASNEEVIEACQTLGCHDILMRLEKGFDTKVGERGANLSQGERQLICIARGLVADPRILILDEATSSVDTQTEMVIQNALEKLFQKRTTFVVAHRLSTVRNANKIIVLKDGRMVESGTHFELLLLGGLYAEMYREFVRG